MKLPFSLSISKKEKSEYFLALLLREEKVDAVIFEEVGGKVHVLGEHQAYFKESIELASKEEWLEVLDKAISSAESVLPKDIETQKTIFGVKDSWVEDAKIKHEYLTKLKHASDSLGLSPIGFLVIHEAIAHYLQQEQGAPATAVLVEVDKKSLAISLLRAGKIVETRRTTVDGSLAKTTDDLLQEFAGYDVFPSKIIIFDGRDAEELSQEFIGHTWSKSLPFLHVPQVKILPKGFDAKAVLFGAATQMGFDVLIKPTEGIKDVATHQETEETKKETGDKEKEEIIEEKTQEIAEPEDKEQETEFGFVKEQDIAKGSAEDEAEEKMEAIEMEAIEKEEEPKLSQPIQKPTVHKTQSENQSKAIVSQIIRMLLSVKHFFPNKTMRSGFFINNKAVAAAGIILGGLILLVIAYMYVLQATVTIIVSPKVVEKDQALTFSPSGPTDFAKGQLKAEPITISEDGTVSTPATGKKSIGTKAKGTVTLFNSSEAKKQLAAGTVLTSSNDVDFTLDKEVIIASASGDIFSGIKSGTAQALVTAKNIGAEANLPSNTKFSVNNTSSVAAKNDSAFSGGTKKDVSVVAKKDVDGLTAELSKNLQTKAKEDIVKKIPSGKGLVPSFIATEVVKKTTDKKVDEEAKTLTLSGTVEYQALAYEHSLLDEYIDELLANEASGATHFTKEKIDKNFAKMEVTKEKTLQTTLHLKAFLIPEMDKENLADEISGKTQQEAIDLLSQKPQVEDVKIVTNPSPPFIPKIMPKISQKISIIIKSNE